VSQILVQTMSMQEPFDDDSLIVDRVLAGESDQFQRLYAKYHTRVIALVRGIVLDSEEAQDVTQEVFTLALRNLTKFDRRSRFGTWLYRIAVNRSIQETRKLRFRFRHTNLDDVDQQLVAAEESTPTIDGNVEAALAKLSSSDRALLTLFYWQELSLQEMAEAMGSNVNAVKTRLYRARERFRVHYEEQEEA